MNFNVCICYSSFAVSLRIAQSDLRVTLLGPLTYKRSWEDYWIELTHLNAPEQQTIKRAHDQLISTWLLLSS